MSVSGFIARACSKDTLVYWGTPALTSDGTMSFTDPVELDCFWMDHRELVKSKEGKEITSNAKVFVTQDLDDQGMVFHGSLTDLTSAEQANPHLATYAFEIIQFVKVTSYRNTDDIVRYILL